MWPSSLLLHLHFALLPWQPHQNRKPLWNSTMQPGMHISRNVTICVLDTPTLLWLACSVPLIPPACSSICWPVGGESAICKKNSIYRWIYKKNVFCFPWFPLASLLWMQMETYLFLLLIYFYICYYTSLKSAWSLLLGELVRLVHCNVNSLCMDVHKDPCAMLLQHICAVSLEFFSLSLISKHKKQPEQYSAVGFMVRLHRPMVAMSIFYIQCMNCSRMIIQPFIVNKGSLNGHGKGKVWFICYDLLIQCQPRWTSRRFRATLLHSTPHCHHQNTK